MRAEGRFPWRPLGAAPIDEARAELRVWAPAARVVEAALGGGRHPLEPDGDGVFAGVLPARAGDDYVYVLDGGEERPDPCSRFQPDGIGGPSQVVATPPVRPGPELWLDELVIYELHVGTFTPEGTFDAAIPRLRALRELGVTAIELMPVATFPGSRGWGYDGVYAYAPHPAYGGPAGLARLVDAAHGEGLGVILDVVYNHVGPGSEAIAAFGPYFTDRHGTFWGDAIDYTRRGVREWAIQNALVWVREYGVDGLRLDATHAIFDEESDEHVLAELARRVKEERPGTLVIAETEIGDLRPIEAWRHDAQWSDRLHHELHVLLTGEREGYYADYGTMDGLVETLRGADARHVVCAQNPAQVGNRALGDRLPFDLLRVAAAVVLLSPGTPLLFMGEEHFEERPFQFFTDHVDPAIAAATREGRRREFEAFAGFRGEVPDPQDERTFERSRLEWREPNPWYRELLRVRRETPSVVEVAADGDVLRLRRGHVELVADFARETVELRP